MRLASVTPLVTTAFVVLPGWASPASRVSACRWADGGRVKTLAALPEFRGDGLPIFPSCTVARVRHL